MSDREFGVTQPYGASCPSGHEAQWTATQVHSFADRVGNGGSTRATFVCPTCLLTPKDI